MKQPHTPTASASAGVSDPAAPGQKATAQASASVPPTEPASPRDPNPEIVDPAPETPLGKEFSTFARTMTNHMDHAREEDRKFSKQVLKVFGTGLILFLLILLIIVVWMGSVAHSLGDSSDVKSNLAKHAEAINKSLASFVKAQESARQSERRLYDASRREDLQSVKDAIESGQDAIGRIESAETAQASAMQKQVDVMKSMSSGIREIKSKTDRIDGLGQSMDGLRDDLSSARNEFAAARNGLQQTSAQVMSELGGLKAKMEAQTPPPPPLPTNPRETQQAPQQTQSLRAPQSYVPAVPVASAAPGEQVFGGGQRMVKGSTTYTKGKYYYVQPGVESPEMSVAEASRATVVQSGYTIIRHYFFWERKPVDVVVPPTGEISFYRNAHKITLLSNQPMQIWIPD